MAQREHDTSDQYFYVHDRLGSVRMVVEYDDTNDEVDTVNSYVYTPFGDFYEVDGDNVDNPWTFTGQWYDEEIAQYYLRARMYDPTMMRFTGRDPVRGEQLEPLTLHKYLYCLNDPIDRTDPSGELAGNIMAGLNNMAAVNAEAVNLAVYSVSTGNDKFLAMAGQIWSLNFILGMGGLVEGVPVNLIGVAQGVAVGFGVDAVYGDYQMSGMSSYLMSTGSYAIFQACAKAFQWTSGISDEEMNEFNNWNRGW